MRFGSVGAPCAFCTIAQIADARPGAGRLSVGVVYGGKIQIVVPRSFGAVQVFARLLLFHWSLRVSIVCVLLKLPLSIQTVCASLKSLLGAVLLSLSGFLLAREHILDREAAAVAIVAWIAVQEHLREMESLVLQTSWSQLLVVAVALSEHSRESEMESLVHHTSWSQLLVVAVALSEHLRKTESLVLHTSWLQLLVVAAALSEHLREMESLVLQTSWSQLLVVAAALSEHWREMESLVLQTSWLQLLVVAVALFEHLHEMESLVLHTSWLQRLVDAVALSGQMDLVAMAQSVFPTQPSSCTMANLCLLYTSPSPRD